MDLLKQNDVEQWVKQLENCHGPFVIIGRPHSGTRVLAETFLKNGIFMGANNSVGFLDDEDWYNRFVYPLMVSRFFPDWDRYSSDQAFNKLCTTRLTETLNQFFDGFAHKHWGWKLSETLFVMPIIKKYLATAKFIHLIRDGRDIALSENGFFQLTGLARQPKSITRRVMRKLGKFRKKSYRNFCLKVTFNRCDLKEWQGIDLTNPEEIIRNRYLVQMQSWINCVNVTRQYGRLMPDSYYEIRYEDLCIAPVQEVKKLFEFLDLPMKPETAEYLATQVKTKAVGKWKNRQWAEGEYSDFQNAVEFGKPLLEELGYTVNS